MQIKLIAYGVAALVLVAALVYGGVHFYNSGYGAASAKYEAQIAKIQTDAAQKLTEEIQRQQAANRMQNSARLTPWLKLRPHKPKMTN